MASDTSTALTQEEKIMEVLNRIEGFVKGIPSQKEIQEQWQLQREILTKSREGWELEAESRKLLVTHIEDMRAVKDLHSASIKQTESLVKQTENLATAQDRLATILDNIGDNLENGFKLGASVVKLFGRITLVFLGSLIILSLVIIWIARMDLSYEGEKGKGSISPRRTSSEVSRSVE